MTLFGEATITAAGTNDAFVLAHASQQGADTVIHTDAFHAITLAGVMLSKLQQNRVTFA